MGDFPFLSAEPELEESSVLLAVVMCTQPLDAELPRTLPCTDVGVFFHAENDEFQRSQKLENCQQRACGSGEGKAAAGSTSPCRAPAVTSTSGRESVRKNGMSEQEGAPTWRSARAEMAEMFGNEQCSQSVKSLGIKAMGVVYKRCFTEERTQIVRNDSPPLLP